jgi:glutathione S-transferase
MNTAPCYRLYGAEVSYFTGKVRAYLRWKNLPFQEMLADATTYREVILPRVGFAVIPVVITPQGETLQDSTAIIDELERRHGEPSVYPHTPLQRLVALLLEVYGDEWLVMPAMHYRWHHNRDWAMRAFGELNAPGATAEEQFAIGQRRAAPFAKAAEALGAEPHMHGAIENSYRNLLAELDAHFAMTPYLPFELDGKQGRRMVGPYSLWMLQRARDAYRSFNVADSEHADRLLASVGGAAFASFLDPPRLQRDGLSAAFE